MGLLIYLRIQVVIMIKSFHERVALVKITHVISYTMYIIYKESISYEDGYMYFQLAYQP